MKMRLFLFLFFACTLLAGRAMAQGCSTKPIDFPPPTTSDKLVPSGTCIANADSGSATGQGGRLRWDNNGSHQLQLFDSDDSGQLLWCANPDNSNGGSSGDTSNCSSKTGSILCLQQDGNMVIYAPKPGQGPIHCVNDGEGGTVVWASGTEGSFLAPPTNDNHEQLLVQENVFFCTSVCITRSGDRAVIQDETYGVLWVSLGYVD